MPPLISLSLLAAGLFVATNVDGLFVLLAYFSDRKHRRSQVVAGEYLGMAVLFAVSAAAASFSRELPTRYVGFLGLVPIAIGCKKILDGKAGAESPDRDPRASKGSGSILEVTAVCVANGGDNVGSYTPQFAVHSGGQIVVMGLVFLLMTGVWCAVAQAVLEHPALKTPIRVHGRRVVPYLLIGLGFLTLYQGGVGGFLFR